MLTFIATVAVTAVVTLFITLIVFNIRSPERKMQHRIKTVYHTGDPQFWRVMSSLLGPPLVGGNKITTLKNGTEIFGAMLAGIRSAQHSVTFETYVYWSGRIGDAFCDALCERAMAGVRVHVLLDYLGTQSMDKKYAIKMCECKVEVEYFHPIHWYNLARINHRTHRKLLTIDGTIGFIGGVGIGDTWDGDARDPTEWRDTHFKVEGPVVAQLQAAFVDNWLKTHAYVLHEEKYFPPLAAPGDAWAQVFKSSPQEGSASARLMFMLSMASARKNIRLSSSYFVPDRLSIRALVDAKKRGVDVEIILPGIHMDMKIVEAASKARWGMLLKKGVKLYLYDKTMYHCKIMIIDDMWVSVGSANFDNRSFRLNDEANLNVLDKALASELIEQFNDDLKECRRLTYKQWKRRPWTDKIYENAAHLVRGQL